MMFLEGYTTLKLCLIIGDKGDMPVSVFVQMSKRRVIIFKNWNKYTERGGLEFYALG